MNLSKFASRKLSVTLLTVGGLVAAHAYAEAAAVAVSYITAQGVIDHATAKKASSVLGTLDEVVEAVRRELQPAPGFVPVPDTADAFPHRTWTPADWQFAADANVPAEPSCVVTPHDVDPAVAAAAANQ